LFNKDMKLTTSLLVFCLILTTLVQAKGAVNLTPVDIDDRLEESLDRIGEESRKEQILTGGVMVVTGGALLAGAALGTLIGNDFSIQTAPAVFLTAGGLLTVGGVMNLSRDNPLNEKIKRFHNRPRIKLEDLQTQIAIGQEILRDEAYNAKKERIWGSILMVVAGGANMAISTFPSTQYRSNFEFAGYSTAAIGAADFMIERRRWTGFSLTALGMANVINDRADWTAPSSDFLLISGSIIVASGIARFFVPLPAEKEQDIFFDSIKTAQLSPPELFVSPVAGGMLAGGQWWW
jgi:hypothetical protein